MGRFNKSRGGTSSIHARVRKYQLGPSEINFQCVSTLFFSVGSSIATIQRQHSPRGDSHFILTRAELNLGAILQTLFSIWGQINSPGTKRGWSTTGILTHEKTYLSLFTVFSIFFLSLATKPLTLCPSRVTTPTFVSFHFSSCFEMFVKNFFRVVIFFFCLLDFLDRQSRNTISSCVSPVLPRKK